MSLNPTQEAINEPNINYNGTDSFTYLISDGLLDNIYTVDITINPVNDPPYFITLYDGLPLAIENQDYICPIEIFDVDNNLEDLTISYQYLPSWLYLVDDQLMGLANIEIGEDFNYELTLSVDDGDLTATNNFGLTVTAVNDAPISYDDDIFLLEDDSIEIVLLGSDLDFDDLTYITNQPQNGSITLSDSIVTYTPIENFNGLDSIIYYVNDGELDSESSLININITNVNDPPEIESIIYDVSDAPFQFDLRSYISDIDDELDSLNITFLPEDNVENIVGNTFFGGNIESTDIDDYTFNYFPSENPPEEDFILYKISDGTLESDPALITFNVLFGRPRPNRSVLSSVPQSMDTMEDTDADVSFIGFNGDPLNTDNNFPADGEGVEVEVIWGPFHGDLGDISLSLDTTSSNYVILNGGYSPHSNYGDDLGIDDWLRDLECSDSGTDSLAYTIYNPIIDEYTDTTVIEFCIHGVNDPPFLFDIENKVLDEDSILEIPITISQDSSITDLVVNSEHITAYDPDSDFNLIDILFPNKELCNWNVE